MPISLGGKPAWMHYRTLGQHAWKTLPLNPVKGWVYRAVLPGNDLVPPGVEIAFSFDASAAVAPAWGPHAVTVMPPTGGDNAPRARRPPTADLKIALTCAATPQFPFLLKWNDILDADCLPHYSAQSGRTEVAPVRRGSAVAQRRDSGSDAR
ncbi:MAG: hypothetical protein ACLQNE_12320 [Thermoguttaceae bacterium]